MNEPMIQSRIEPMAVLQSLPKVTGVRVGRVVGLRHRETALVDFPGNPFGPAAARLTKSVAFDQVRTAFHAGAPVLLTFENNDPGFPILFDVVDAPPSEHPEPAVQADEAVSICQTAKAAVPVPTAEPLRPMADGAIARIVSIQDGQVTIQWPDSTAEPRPARTAVALRNLVDDVIVLTPAGGDPVIVGQVYSSAAILQPGSTDADIVLRGHTIRIEAEKEVRIKAGNCEIMLDARGKATTVADHVVSRARGVNKVQGGSVRLN